MKRAVIVILFHNHAYQSDNPSIIKCGVTRITILSVVKQIRIAKRKRPSTFFLLIIGLVQDCSPGADDKRISMGVTVNQTHGIYDLSPNWRR